MSSPATMYEWPIECLENGFRADLPLNLRVTSVSFTPDQHAIYHLTISSRVTHRSWSVAYRYAEFAAFRDLLETRWTCHDAATCTGACAALRACCRSCFPRKRWLGSTSARCLEERRHKLECVLLHLVRSVWLPGNALQCSVARKELPRHVMQFLRVTSAVDQRSVLQAYVEGVQQALQDSTTVCSSSSPRLSLASTASTLSFDDASSSCSDSNEGSRAATSCKHAKTPRHQHRPRHPYCCAHDAEATVVLPCHHAFHRECIFEWLQVEFACPLCHDAVTPKTARMNVCKAGEQVQWWLGSFADYRTLH